MNDTAATRAREGRIATAAAALASRAHEGPTALLSMTDEQLLVLSGRDPNSALVTPWVDAHAQSEQDHDLLLRSTARAMLAGGQVSTESTLAALEERDPMGEPSDLLPVPVAAGVLGRRGYSQLRVTATDLDASERGALQQFADSDGTVMLEQISANGIHHFTMCTREAAIELASPWIFGQLPTPGEGSPLPVSEDSDTPEVVTGRYEQLRTDSPLADILQGAERRIAFLAEDRRARTTQVMWVITAGTEHIAVQPADETLDPEALEEVSLEALRVSRAGIAAQLSDFLTVA
ncbi:hypothetical protein [Brachybacterium sp. Marseille-Q7125]|uniref:hypothetical protein n=1 Tax=Brachybacterium sp. Marseille-Q7125 TaxID=2932815 RepID=UPI001FF3E644|nr:hypothetical protein [Brachybacterium sp. Marseille-Q7125]